MNWTSLNISREQSYIMRGLAIVCIALHNLCHSLKGVIHENEFSFEILNVDRILSVNKLTIKTLYDVLSFFGWYGVPVFIFLSGYGLVKKYEQNTINDLEFSRKNFIFSNYKKLFFLMFPGAMMFILIQFIFGYMNGTVNWFAVGQSAFTMTLVSNLTYPILEPAPGVYWYFGLALQLYVLYAFIFKGCRNYWLLVLSLVCIIPQYLMSNILWLRHNCISWIPIFALGIWCSRYTSINKTLFYSLLAFCVISFIPATLNTYSWQWSVIAAVGIFMFVAKVSNRIQGWRQFWVWVGKLSPYLFASHPILRAIMLKLTVTHHLSMLTLLTTYSVGIFLFALLYRWLCKLIKNVPESMVKRFQTKS